MVFSMIRAVGPILAGLVASCMHPAPKPMVEPVDSPNALMNAWRKHRQCETPPNSATDRATTAAPSKPTVWSRAIGGQGWDEVEAIATGPDGSLWLIGQFESSTLIGDNALHADGDTDLFVAKLSVGGDILWSMPISGPGRNFAGDIAVDREGNAVLVGSFRDSIRAGNQALIKTEGDGTFIAKLSAEGVVRWAVPITSPRWSIGAAIATDVSGDVLVTGVFANSLRVGNLQTQARGEAAVYLARIEATGRPLWLRSLGGPGWDEARDVTVDRNGNATVVGLFDGQVKFGSTQQQSTGKSDAFIAQWSDEGELLWSKRLGGKGVDGASAVIADSHGALFVGGHFSDTARFGGPALAAEGLTDAFVAQFSSDGTHLWSKAFGGPDRDCARSLALSETTEGSDSLFVAGGFGRTIRVGKQTLVGYGRDSLYVTRMDARSGKPHTSIAITGPAVHGHVARAKDRTFVAGSFLDIAQIAAATILKSTGGFDGFVLALRLDEPD